MQHITVKIGTAIAVATLVTSALAPAAFATTVVTVDNNGHKSTNIVSVSNKTSTKVQQGNSNSFWNWVGSFINTGGNKVKDNTGDGGNAIVTGDGNTTTNITNGGSSNDATVHSNCGCESGGTSVDVSDNGSKSYNVVSVSNSNHTTVQQSNQTETSNTVINGVNTGGNHVSDNTGDGTNSVQSGNGTSTTTIVNGGSSNTASL